jgi:hypothetical protein
MRNPSPITFRMGVLSRILSLGVSAGRNRRFGCGNIQMKVPGAIDAIALVVNGDNMRESILAILETRYPDNTAAVGASGIAAEGDGKNFQGTFLPFEIEAINPPQHLILARRSREN